jgi:hypothetical protein
MPAPRNNRFETEAPDEQHNETLHVRLEKREREQIVEAAGKNGVAASAAGRTPRATIALEARLHSPWLSRYLTELDTQGIVADPRKLQVISRQERKCDHAERSVGRNGPIAPALTEPSAVL